MSSQRSIAVVVGNPQPASRTRRLAELVAARVTGDGASIRTIDVADLGPALLEWGSESVLAAKEAVRSADALVVASPTYKASYTGLLKLFLDQFDKAELGGKPTVAVMTGGSPHHSLAVNVHLIPVLVEIGASVPASGLYVWGADQDDPDAAVSEWIETAGNALRAFAP